VGFLSTVILPGSVATPFVWFFLPGRSWGLMLVERGKTGRNTYLKRIFGGLKKTGWLFFRASWIRTERLERNDVWSSIRRIVFLRNRFFSLSGLLGSSLGSLLNPFRRGLGAPRAIGSPSARATERNCFGSSGSNLASTSLRSDALLSQGSAASSPSNLFRPFP
jgi:hypothetical protein